MDSDNRPEPCMPTPMMPKRTAALDARLLARAGVTALAMTGIATSDEAAAAVPSPRNSLRERSSFACMMALLVGGIGALDNASTTTTDQRSQRNCSRGVAGVASAQEVARWRPCPRQ